MDKNIDEEGSGTTGGYVVEVRAKGDRPVDVGGRIIYPSWQTAKFTEHEAGVPTQQKRDPNRHIKEMHGKMSYQAAMALAWWIHASHGESLITRLRRYSIEFTYKITDDGCVSEHDGSVSPEKPQHDSIVEAWTYSADKYASMVKDMALQGNRFWERTDPALGTESAATKEPVGNPTGAKRTTERPGASRATPNKKKK